MIKKSLFLTFTLITVLVLVFYSRIKKDNSLAIVAEVEPQKTAVSFHKPIRVQAVHVKPGQHVMAGDLLLTVERPDLLLDIQQVENDQAQLDAEEAKIHSTYQTGLQVRKLKHELEMGAIDQQIKLLRESQRSDSSIYRQLSNNSERKVPSLHIRMNSLLDERNLQLSQYRTESNRQKQLTDRDLEALALQRKGLENERITLKQEQAALKQYAPFNGTIGAVSVQLMELVPPFKTIISIYEEHPSLIKAYLNEKSMVSVQVGDTVRVSSINRTYAIAGNIVEVGSRIVSYPKQMNSFGQQQMWGKEVFVQIADRHDFLSGEKVYVRLSQD